MGAAKSTLRQEPEALKNDIDNDSKRIEMMLLSAKNGEWNKVWQILGSPDSAKSACIINVIPENRRWGIIHQAVFWNNADILRHLLSYPECDSDMRTKQCTSECGDTSRKTPTKLAEAFGYQSMSQIVRKHTNSVENQKIPTLILLQNYSESSNSGLIFVTLAAYKNTFHPQPISRQKTIMSVLQDIYTDINSSDERWKEVMGKVCDCVYIVCKKNYERIKQSTSRQEFYQNVINMYTEEDNRLYTNINVAFRRQKEGGYKPTGDDLALGPYAVMCQMLLLFWEDLPVEIGVTYRKMCLQKTDVDQYKRGIRFVWQSVTSSSIKRDSADAFPTIGPEGDLPVMFTIDNSTKSAWQPRNIDKQSHYHEYERTYPAGAKFCVINSNCDNGEYHINLKLLN